MFVLVSSLSNMKVSTSPAAGPRRLVIVSSGRPSFGNDSSRLIVPGNSQRQQGTSNGIILPGTASRRPPPLPPGQANFPELAMERDLPPGMQNAQPITLRNFRPPVGFMNEDGPEADPTIGKSTDELISKLTSRSDYWYMLAKIFPRLYRDGLDGAILEELISLTPARQNTWIVASNVYNSLRLSGKLTKEQMSFFDNEDNGPECLMELRFLDIDRRVEGARYIVDNQLGPSDSVQLGRAIKEHERRPDNNEGFTRAAGDCLAFKYFRDAQEARKPEDVTRFVNAGLRVAESESANAKLRALLPTIQSEEVGPAPELVIVRLSKDDVGTRVLPVLGTLGEVTAQDVINAPSISTEGSFSIFNAPNPALRYVALPRYNFLAVSRHPVALLIPDASLVPEILQATGSKNDRDAAKLKSQAMAIVDIKPEEVKATEYYLVEKDGGVAFAAGNAAKNPIGQVIFVMMPHRRDALSTEGFEF